MDHPAYFSTPATKAIQETIEFITNERVRDFVAHHLVRNSSDYMSFLFFHDPDRFNWFFIQILWKAKVTLLITIPG